MITVKPREFVKVSLIVLMLFIITMGSSIGWAVIHTILMKRVGFQYLPYTYIAYNLACMCGVFIYLALLDRYRPENILQSFACVAGMIIVVSRIFITNRFSGNPELSWQLVLFFGLVIAGEGVCSSTLLMQVWSIINDLFLPNHARRLYPLFGVSGMVGGLAGGLVLNLVDLLGIGNIVFLWGLALFLIVPLAYFCQKWYGGGLRSLTVKQSALGDYTKNISEGFTFLNRSVLAKVLAGMCVVFWLVFCLQDFLYAQIMNRAFPSEESLGRYYGFYSILFNTSSIALQFFTAEQLVRRLGVFIGLWIMPLVGCLGFIALVIQFGFWEGLFFRFAFDIVGVVCQGNSYQLSFNAFPLGIRPKIRGLMEGVFNPIGAVIGGVLIILIQMSFTHTGVYSTVHERIFSVTGLALSLSWLFLVIRGRKYYIQAVIDNLQNTNKSLLLDSIESLEERGEPAAYQTLRSVLREDNPQYDTEVKSKAMEVISRLDNINAIVLLSRFLEHDSSLLRAKAIASMRTLTKLHDHPFALHYLNNEMKRLLKDDPSMEVRVEAGTFLFDYYPKDALPEFIHQLWHTSDQASKVLAIRALHQLPFTFDELTIFQGLKDTDPVVRGETIIALWNIPELEFDCHEALKGLLKSTNPIGQQQGLRTLIALKYPAEYAPFWEQPQAYTDLHTQFLACVAYLSFYPSDSQAWDSIVRRTVQLMSDSNYPDEERKEAADLLITSKDEILDAYFISLLQLPHEQKVLATRGLDKMVQVFETVMNQYDN